MAIKDKWETLHRFKFAFYGPKEEKKEESKEEKRTTAESTTRIVPPQSHKPPMSHPALGNDRRDETGEEKGEKGHGKCKGQDKGEPKWQKGVRIHGTRNKGGNALPNVEEGREQASQYTSRAQHWGPLGNKKRGWKSDGMAQETGG